MKKSTTTIEVPDGLRDISRMINNDWHPIHYSALPYLNAMYSLSDMKSSYGADSASNIVTYFLANAQTWRGETARAVKAKLNKMLKQK